MSIKSLCLFLAMAACHNDKPQYQPHESFGAAKSELLQHAVSSNGHPIALWEKSDERAEEAILLVHGRTWSAIPDFDLQVEGEELSLMDGLVANGYAVYAIDMRGYGATPRDSTGWLTPDQAAEDLVAVLKWIAQQKNWVKKPHLFGWSMGSTNSFLLAQRYPELISSLFLYGFWYDIDLEIPASEEGITPAKATNTAEAAASDFITEGSISQKAVDAFVKSALEADPVRVDYRDQDQYNAIDPTKIIVPTMILQGEFDPIAPTSSQAKVFAQLSTAHKQWVTIPGGDHAAHLETPRALFIHTMVSFMAGLDK